MSTFKAYSIEPAYGPRTWETVRTVAKSAAADHGGSFREEDVPATKAGLIPFLNEIERQAYERGKAQAEAGSLAGHDSPPPAPIEAPKPAPAPVAPPSPIDLTVDAIEEAILESKGAPFGRFLSAAIGRLGALGRDGWAEFQAFRNFTRDAERSVGRDKRPYLPAYDERGLRLLALAQIANLDDGRAF
jgi:hypothetical protein